MTICDNCAYKGRDDENCNPAKLMQVIMEDQGCETCGGCTVPRFFQSHTDLPIDYLKQIQTEACLLREKGLKRDINRIAEHCLNRHETHRKQA